MAKYELSLSPDYVPDWTIVDAVRELFQNALDQQSRGDEMSYNWSLYVNTVDGDALYTLSITNEGSILRPSSLLLGATTKANDESTIGTFGEGYKMAALVLTRLGKIMTVQNYGVHEEWKPRFSKSRKYKSDILVFDIHRVSKVPHNNLTIAVDGITVQEMNDIIKSNLHLHTYTDIKTNIGSILLDEDKSGQVFVNGLYVCTHKPYKYGYNFKPGKLKIDRDRRIADSFDLEWLASTVWSEENAPNDLLIDLVQQGAADVKFFNSTGGTTKAFAIAAKRLASIFKEYNGDNAVPVTTQEEADAVPEGYKAVIVKEGHKHLLDRSGDIEMPKPESRPLRELFQEWFVEYDLSLVDEAAHEFNELVDKIPLGLEVDV